MLKDGRHSRGGRGPLSRQLGVRLHHREGDRCDHVLAGDSTFLEDGKVRSRPPREREMDEERRREEQKRPVRVVPDAADDAHSPTPDELPPQIAKPGRGTVLTRRVHPNAPKGFPRWCVLGRKRG